MPGGAACQTFPSHWSPQVLMHFKSISVTVNRKIKTKTMKIVVLIIAIRKVIVTTYTIGNTSNSSNNTRRLITITVIIFAWPPAMA